MDSIINIVWNVVGGAITVGIIESFKFAYSKYVYSKFKDIFGKNIISFNEFNLTYAQLFLPQDMLVKNKDGTDNTHPYIKDNLKNNFHFSIQRPISSCEVRAAKYLTETIGKEVKASPLLSSDVDLQGRLDISFVAFGGPRSNYKTRDVIENSANDLLKFNNEKFTTALSGKTVLKTEEGFDYGLILKIHPKQFPKQNWFACAGIDEWGTSGAAWYLAKKWREIHNFAGESPFAIIVRVKPGQDEYAEPVVKVKSPTDAEQYAITD